MAASPQQSNTPNKEQNQWPLDFFDLKAACEREVQRRLRLLGPSAHAPYHYHHALERAREVSVPFPDFNKWLKTFHEKGEAGLYPHHWTPLSSSALEVVRDRYLEFGHLMEAEIITEEQMVDLAERTGRSFERVTYWVRRVRTGGLWSLAPENNPNKNRRKEISPRPPRDEGDLNESELEKIFYRRNVLGDLADKASISDNEAAECGRRHGVSARTIRYWHKRYDVWGLRGLAPSQRSDKGTRHKISPRIVRIIKGLRETHFEAPVDFVYEETCKRAQALGEIEPTFWQVRDIIANIPKAEKFIADKNENKFRNSCRFTGPIDWNKHGVVYQIDNNYIDLLVKDLRDDSVAKKGKQVRLWKTTCVCARSGRVLAAEFGYDQADQYRIGAVIRQALLVGGIPDEIWTDFGAELISDYVQQICRELKIDLVPTKRPELKGVVERSYRSYNTLFWRRKKGYINSNTALRNPNAKAEFTPYEIIDQYWEFTDLYNNKINKKTGRSRLQHCTEECFTDPVDPRLLDILLLKPIPRKVQKNGISYLDHPYNNEILSEYVSQRVTIRVPPGYEIPRSVEVFRDGKWLCTAHRIDVETGSYLRPNRLKDAQREQRRSLRANIEQNRAALRDADREIAATQSSPTTPASTNPKQPEASTDTSKPQYKKKAKQKPRILDRMDDDWPE